MRESYHTPMKQPPTLRTLVCSPTGLNYCCLWAFFRKHKRTTLVALRLGVSTRDVQYWRARFRAGEFKCEASSRCLKPRVLL